MGGVSMNPFSEIETWRGFVEKLPSDEDKLVLKKLLNDCYKYSLAMNEHSRTCISIRDVNYDTIINITQRNIYN
jgi:hypothetical protein